jgi:hypothetical protein
MGRWRSARRDTHEEAGDRTQLGAQSYARERFQGLGCAFAQLFWQASFEIAPRRRAEDEDGGRPDRFASGSKSPKKRPERNVHFAMRNETLPMAWRKLLKSLRAPNQ